MVALGETAFRADVTPYTLMKSAATLQEHAESTGRRAMYEASETVYWFGLQLQEIRNLPETWER